MSDKWDVSWEAWNNNKNSNYNKALEEYNQRVADAVNDYYTNNGPGGQYYFREDDPTAEYNDIVNKLQQQDIKNMQNYLDSNFAGLGGSNMWLDNYWTGNELNDLSSAFITDNYNKALDKLDQAYSSGYLNNNGYNNALNALDKQRSAARSTVDNIGLGILDDYKQDLINKVQGYQTDLSNYDLNKSNTINSDAWNTNLNNFYNKQKNDLTSKFDSATSELNLFDTSDLIGNAKVDQGISNIGIPSQNDIDADLSEQNLSVSDYYNQLKNKRNQNNTNESQDNLFNAINEQNKRKNKNIGLGNAGLF